MPTVADLKSWRSDLTEILDVCAQRASLPVTLPHCAICARYATDNLPFEALMSLLDVMPDDRRPEALAAAEERLATMPPAMRQQQVDAVTLPILMDSPGWPLVRSLVIDMANQEIHKHFDDPRLGAIEEITLLGFAYGGCEVRPEFNDALFNSRGLTSLRSLIFHSTESDADMSRGFWSSPLARRLEHINGVPYFGDPVPGPLAVRELALGSCGKFSDGFSLRPLLDPSTSPHLTKLSLGAFSEALDPLLRLLAAECPLLERIENVTLGLSDYSGERTQLMRSATLPASATTVSWYADFRHVSNIRIRCGCDVHTFYDSTHEKIDVRCSDKVTDYRNLIFDWRLRDHISRRVDDLSLLLPLEIDVGEVIAFCGELPHLRKFALVYPFTEAELETLLDAERIRRLESLTLLLTVNGGQWDFGSSSGGRTNEYMKANESRYQSNLSAKWLFDLAFGERTASIHHLSIATPAFELTRSPERVQHWDIRTEDAAYALAQSDPRRPIEVLCFGSELTIGEPLAKALAASDVPGHVYRLNLLGPLDDAAARVLAGCEKLRTVRVFGHWCFHNSPEAIQAILHSPHLTGVWDLNLSMKASWEAPELDAICATSPLLDRAVALDLHGPDKSPLIPESGRLGRVRRLDEWLSMHVLGDARLAAMWRDHPIGRPLRARLAEFVERTYRVDHTPEDLPELERRLANSRPFQEEDAFQKNLFALLATAFDGKPAAEGTPFAELNEQQRRALRAIAHLNKDWWSLGGLIHDAMTSYGFNFWGKEDVERYIAGTED